MESVTADAPVNIAVVKYCEYKIGSGYSAVQTAPELSTL